METKDELVQEVDETTPEPEVEKTEESETETTTKVEAEKPNYYTPEEIEDILASDGELDSKRLSPEGRLLQRSFQKGLTPKLQERTELKKRLEELEKRVPTQKPNTIEEAYDTDPEGTLNYLNSEIRQRHQKMRPDEDPISALKLMQEIDQIRDVKENLTYRDLRSTKKRSEVNEIVGEVESEVLKEIPDFVKRRDKLSDFAIEKLGYSPEEVQKLSDPMIVGTSARSFILDVNKRYEMENASKTLPRKEVKTVPKTESAGKGESDTANSTYAAALKKAQKTGDWGEVLRLKGVLDKITPT